MSSSATVQSLECTLSSSQEPPEFDIQHWRTKTGKKFSQCNKSVTQGARKYLDSYHVRYVRCKRLYHTVPYTLVLNFFSLSSSLAAVSCSQAFPLSLPPSLFSPIHLLSLPYLSFFVPECYHL